MMILATIGPTALYLLFVWLISAAICAWMSERKGYGERVGLTFGLLLSAVGLLIVLILPGRPGSKWKVEGAMPKRAERHPGFGPEGEPGGGAGGSSSSSGSSGPEA